MNETKFFRRQFLSRATSTGGWGFAQFKDGKPDSTAALQTCYACHTLVRANDFVFTHYAATP
jgi:hypothetical protein